MSRRRRQPTSVPAPRWTPEVSVAGTEACLPELGGGDGRKTPPPFSRRKNPRQRKAMAERGYQTYGLQRLGTLADIWPGVGP
jgi:hypothetical protein